MIVRLAIVCHCHIPHKCKSCSVIGSSPRPEAWQTDIVTDRPEVFNMGYMWRHLLTWQHSLFLKILHVATIDFKPKMAMTTVWVRPLLHELGNTDARLQLKTVHVLSASYYSFSTCVHFSWLLAFKLGTPTYPLLYLPLALLPLPYLHFTPTHLLALLVPFPPCPISTLATLTPCPIYGSIPGSVWLFTWADNNPQLSQSLLEKDLISAHWTSLSFQREKWG